MKNYCLVFLFVVFLFCSCSSKEDSDEILVENNIEIPLSIYQKIYKTTSEIYIEDGFVYINTDGVPDHKSPYFLDTEWENEMYEPYDGTNPFVTNFNLNPNRISAGNIRFKIPVSPKNIFPSNIQGLPTWFEVRVNEKGYLGSRGGVDIAVAMNPQSYSKDVDEILPGGYLLYDSTWKRNFNRTYSYVYY